MATYDHLLRPAPAEPDSPALEPRGESLGSIGLSLPTIPPLGEIDLSSLRLADLGLRREGHEQFLTPALNRVMQFRDIRDYGQPLEREEFRRQINRESPSTYNDSFLDFRLDASAFGMTFNSPLKIDPVEGRHIVRLIDIRDDIGPDVSLHLLSSAPQPSHPGDQEFRYAMGEGNQRFLFQRAEQLPERGLLAGFDGVGEQLWRYGRPEDQHLVFGVHSDTSHLILGHSGLQTTMGAIYENQRSSETLSFAYTRNHNGRGENRDSFALGYFGEALQLELNYNPGDTRRPLSGYLRPLSAGLRDFEFAPVIEFDTKGAALEHPLASPLTGFLFEHRGRSGYGAIRGVMGEKTYKIEAGLQYSY